MASSRYTYSALPDEQDSRDNGSSGSASGPSSAFSSSDSAYHRQHHPFPSPRSGPTQSTSFQQRAAKVLYSWTVRFATPLCSITLVIVFLLSLFAPRHRAPLATPRSIFRHIDSLKKDPNGHLIHPRPRPIGPALPRSIQEDNTLTIDQCQEHFPLFYPQLLDNVHAWRQRGGIKASQIADAVNNCHAGCMHVVISGGQVFLRSFVKDWQSRTKSTLQLLQKAVEGASFEEQALLEGTELVLSAADRDGFSNGAGGGAGWVLDKRLTDEPGQFIFPDFSFAAWPEAGSGSYPEFRREAEEMNALYPWSTKANQAFWRGDPNVGGPRMSLFEHVAKSGSEEWIDVKRTSFWETGPQIAPLITPVEHCQHKFLLQSEGNAYSGRSKYILGCTSAVILHNLVWTQHFHPALISSGQEGVTFGSNADQNVIQSPGESFSGLETLMKELLAEEKAVNASVYASSPAGSRLSEGKSFLSPSSLFSSSSSSEVGTTRSHSIALNAHRTLTSRYLTPAATSCYIRSALAFYRSILDTESSTASYEVELATTAPNAERRLTVTLPVFLKRPIPIPFFPPNPQTDSQSTTRSTRQPTSPILPGSGVLPGSGTSSSDLRGEAALIELLSKEDRGMEKTGDVAAQTWWLFGSPAWPVGRVHAMS